MFSFTLRPCSHNMPQGLVFEPFQICIYFAWSDSPTQLTKYRIHMYAADTVLYYSAKMTDRCQQMQAQDVDTAGL